MHGSTLSRAAHHSPRRMASNRRTSYWVSLEFSYPFCYLISNLLLFFKKKVTRFMRIDDHKVDDWRPAPLPPVSGIGRATPPFGAPAFPQNGGFGAASAFPHQGFGAQALSVPSVVYLITSSRPDFATYITDDPMGRPRPRPTGSTSWCFSCRSG